jgi:hypothetical protein
MGLAKIGLCLGPALWAGVAAQTLSPCRVGPALSTRAWVVLFRAMPRAANRAWPWNSISVIDM